MKCPRCSTNMYAVTFQGITIDRCSACGGILLDKGEAEAIDRLNIGNDIERGVPRSALDSSMMPARCHECNQAMMALTGAGDIEFDWCERCERIFFDRGELAAFDAAKGG